MKAPSPAPINASITPNTIKMLMLGNSDFVVESQFLQALPCVALANVPIPLINTAPASIAPTVKTMISPSISFAATARLDLKWLLIFVGDTPAYTHLEIMIVSYKDTFFHVELFYKMLGNVS